VRSAGVAFDGASFDGVSPAGVTAAATAADAAVGGCCAPNAVSPAKAVVTMRPTTGARSLDTGDISGIP
jgi:hypothetical protein